MAADTSLSESMHFCSCCSSNSPVTGSITKSQMSALMSSARFAMVSMRRFSAAGSSGGDASFPVARSDDANVGARCGRKRRGGDVKAAAMEVHSKMRNSPKAARNAVRMVSRKVRLRERRRGRVSRKQKVVKKLFARKLTFFFQQTESFPNLSSFTLLLLVNWRK